MFCIIVRLAGSATTASFIGNTLWRRRPCAAA
jgi:hypothetical protein